MLASDILTRARTVLNDNDKTRWTDDELLKWTSDGQRVIALVRPDASVLNFVMTGVVGTKQSIPNDGLRLLDVVRNINASGNGTRAIRIVDREVLDSQNPDWHSLTAAAQATNYCYDNRDPKVFYVYPPVVAGTKFEIIYSKVPTDVVALGDTVAVADIYQDPLLNYVLHRAYSKDAEFAQNAQLSAGYLTACMTMLGVKSAKDLAFSPDMNSKNSQPNVAAATAGGI